MPTSFKIKSQDSKLESCNINFKIRFNSNMTSYMGYINNTVIKFLLYHALHMCMVEQIVAITPK